MTASRARDQQLAEQWASHLAAGELDDLLALYGRTAPLHVARDVLVGPDEIRRFWERSPLLGGPSPERVTRANGVEVVRWPNHAGGGIAPASEMLIRHGRIAEQWVGDAVLGETVLGAIPLELSTSGAVSAGDRRAVADVLEKVLAPIVDDVVHARVRLEHATDRNRTRPTTIRVVIDVKGGIVRADVAADTTRAAVDGLEARLRAQLRHRLDRRSDHRRGPVGSGSWRHGAPVAERPDYFPRPADERQIVRHKSVAPAWSTVDEALFDLRSMDYDFYLFADAMSGADALVHRSIEPDGRPGSGYVVRFVDGVDDEVVDSVPAAVEIDHRPAPLLDADAARERLDAGHEPWVLFVDAVGGRGHVLYRRYDGHYGLLVPIDESDE